MRRIHFDFAISSPLRREQAPFRARKMAPPHAVAECAHGTARRLFRRCASAVGRRIIVQLYQNAARLRRQQAPMMLRLMASIAMGFRDCIFPAGTSIISSPAYRSFITTFNFLINIRIYTSRDAAYQLSYLHAKGTFTPYLPQSHFAILICR